MASIFALLVFFLIIGIFARSFNNRTRLLLAVGIIGLLLYLYLT
jgi:hypothetical protein